MCGDNDTLRGRERGGGAVGGGPFDASADGIQIGGDLGILRFRIDARRMESPHLGRQRGFGIGKQHHSACRAEIEPQLGARLAGGHHHQAAEMQANSRHSVGIGEEQFDQCFRGNLQRNARGKRKRGAESRQHQ